jgi:hypothetical protein
VESEIQKIENLIRSAIISTTKTNGSLASHFAKTRKAVAEERITIKKQFVLQAMSLESKLQRKLFVRFHQRYLINLIDELFELSQAKSRTKGCLASELFFFYDQLEDILIFLKNEFPEYHDNDAKLPEPHAAKFVSECKRKFASLTNLMTGVKIDQTLALVSTCPIRKVLNREQTVSYHLAQFVDSLIEELSILVGASQKAEDCIDDAVRHLLIHLNYNDESFFNYYTEFIRVNLLESECVADQLEKLALQYKLVNQFQPHRGSFYNTKIESISERLSHWMLEEVQYLEKRLQLVSNSRQHPENPIKDDFKIEVDMSVSQFACFIKVFIEAGIIQNKNISELLRFFSRFVKTKKSESISNESFRIKYYNVESGTKQSVRNMFHTAISYINSN